MLQDAGHDLFLSFTFSRYADFIVNEVDPLGNVVHLTCLDPLEEACQPI